MNVANNAHKSINKSLNVYSDAMNINIDAVIENNQSNKKVHFLNVQEFLSSNKKNISPMIMNGTYMYDETNHLYAEESKLFADWLLSEIK